MGMFGASARKAKKKAARNEPDRLSLFGLLRLTLRELEAAAGLGAAVLLALPDARIASQEAFPLHGGAKARLVAGKRGRDCRGGRAGPAGKDAARNGGRH